MDRCSVSPDLVPNCLQRLSAVDKVTARMERVNLFTILLSNLFAFSVSSHILAY